MTGGLLVRGLSKRQGAVQAVADVGFAVAPGEIVGLLGPNGAGKTTTIEAVTGLVTPDAGEIMIDGIDARADPRGARRRIGVLLQATGLPERITPREAVALFAALHDARPDGAALLARFGLAEKADAAFATLSGGQQQRLALALAFVGRPAAVFLDEPTAGLDPAMRRELHVAIAAMRAEGCAILLATHDMEEAERLCDRVAVLDRGRIVAEGTPAALIAGARTATRVIARADRVPPDGWPETLPGAEAFTGEGDVLRFVAHDLHAALAALLTWLDGRGAHLAELRTEGATLEDVILLLTGVLPDHTP